MSEGFSLKCEVFERTAFLLSEGWTQGVERREAGRNSCYCLFGAFQQAVADLTVVDSDDPASARRHYSGVSQLWDGLFNFAKGRGIPEIITWHDAPRRTQQEVVALVTDYRESLTPNHCPGCGGHFGTHDDDGACPA